MGIPGPEGILSACALSPWVSAKLQDLILALALISCVTSGTTSLISRLIICKVCTKSILKMAATPSHSSWSKRVISLLPESTAASPRESGPAWEADLRVSESRMLGRRGPWKPPNQCSSQQGWDLRLLGTENMTHPRPPHQSQNRWGGAQESS